MKFFTTEQIGPKRALTPEGFLLCEDVPIARVGSQIYGPGETPITAGPDGVVMIYRTAAEVFAVQTIASIRGKDVVNDHPVDDVLPHNYKQLTCGVILDPRRGEGTEDELLIADLLVKDAAAIKAIMEGKIEVSLGYDADYVQTGPGAGEQRNIRVNHVALVDRGRCGPRCSISDHHHEHAISKTTDSIPEEPECGCHTKETSLMKSLKQRVLDALKGKVRDEDMPAIGAAMDKAKDELGEGTGAGEIHLHLGPAGTKTSDEEYCSKADFDKHVQDNAAMHSKMRDDFEAFKKEVGEKAKPAEGQSDEDAEKENAEVKDELEEEAPEGKTKDAAKARDSAYLEDSFSDTLAKAEIIVPGIKPPMTFDRARRPADTYKNGICALRRRALDGFAATDVGKAFVEANLPRGKTLDGLTCARVSDMFRAAVAHKSALNNGMVGDISLNSPGQNTPAFGSTPVLSVASLAEQAAAAWSDK